VPDEPLENTYWKLIRVGDAPAVAAPQRREPHFILHRDGKRVSGSGGCNQFIGGYEVKGDQLSFTRLAKTAMACVETMDSEREFLAALQRVRVARIRQMQLELLDASGTVVARFDAVHFR
ncbi:MAG TPA: META domain-containing protein, partial [Burkholderiales bacterium]|nr:META domain-containing protein [Burkholderiales bacterium]